MRAARFGLSLQISRLTTCSTAALTMAHTARIWSVQMVDHSDT